MGRERRKVVESLGSSPPQQRHGAPESVKSVEEVALRAAHDAARAVVLMFRAADLSRAEEVELGGLLDSLYDRWQAIGVWKPGQDRVPVVGKPGSATVEWEAQG